MIQLDLKSRKSIYEQIVDGFKELVTSGVLKSGDKMPSVRELSKMLTVNPNTIQKAYRKLEDEGWVYMVPGLGCFVSDKPQAPDMEKAQQIYAQIGECVKQLLFIGLTAETIQKDIAVIINERGHRE